MDTAIISSRGPFRTTAAKMGDCPNSIALNLLLQAEKALDKTFDLLDEAEEQAKDRLGSRPFGLVGWRHYSAIGGAELERAKTTILRRGIDPAIVEAEFHHAKRRYQQALKAGKEWDEAAGIAEIRRTFVGAQRHYRKVRDDWARTPPTTLEGLATMASMVARDMTLFSDDYIAVAANSVAKGIRLLADDARYAS
ncbi:hypothetical protein [Devosia sp.]|uniref:hypothetical protein n=1 Tax=Devosia sp. TaxID=1871048 RepID=UPI001ACE80E9|nr:hypothetical protein [Devosia sp.]MBN9333274.1 hypothetical protein [Devosia sp.]